MIMGLLGIQGILGMTCYDYAGCFGYWDLFFVSRYPMFVFRSRSDGFAFGTKLRSEVCCHRYFPLSFASLVIHIRQRKVQVLQHP